MQQYWVRVGLVGNVGRFRSLQAGSVPRGAQVICRTPRGLEMGELLSVAEQPASAWDGDLIRQTTPEDQLLWQRLLRHQREALDACQRMLDQRGLPSVLLDVEPTFDGKSLYFYFLGDVSPEVSQVTAELAEAYDAVAQLGRFGEVLTSGCGPDCGTHEGSCDSHCSGCAVACGLPRSGARSESTQR